MASITWPRFCHPQLAWPCSGGGVPPGDEVRYHQALPDASRSAIGRKPVQKTCHCPSPAPGKHPNRRRSLPPLPPRPPRPAPCRPAPPHRPIVVEVVRREGAPDGGVVCEDVVEADGGVGQQPDEDEGGEEEAAGGGGWGQEASPSLPKPSQLFRDLEGIHPSSQTRMEGGEEEAAVVGSGGWGCWVVGQASFLVCSCCKHRAQRCVWPQSPPLPPQPHTQCPWPHLTFSVPCDWRMNRRMRMPHVMPTTAPAWMARCASKTPFKSGLGCPSHSTAHIIAPTQIPAL